MLIFFLTDQPEICHIMADRLTEHSSHIFTNVSDIYDAVQSLRVPPDLFVVDYSMYNHEIFNLSEYMEEIKYRIPTIFYNEPCLIAGNRPDHWQQIILLTYGYKDTQDPEEYYSVYKIIESVVEDPDISQYIPLLQKPKMLPKNFYVTKMYDDTSIREAKKRLIDFKIKTNIPDNLFFILQLLYRNGETCLSLEEIQQYYEKELRSISIESLKVQISKLKKYLIENPEDKMILTKKKDGYQLLML